MLIALELTQKEAPVECLCLKQQCWAMLALQEVHVQTCTQCRTYSPDEATNCVRCGADLSQFSATSVALAHLRANPRVGTIRLIPHQDCCQACQEEEGEWDKAEVPALPVPGCSHFYGCRCFYEPQLKEMYP